jgi:CBS domain-containing membrane protein
LLLSQGYRVNNPSAWWLRFKPEPVTVSTGERLRSGLAALLAVFATAAASLALPGGGWLVTAVGASSVLLFVLPGGPLSQPWPVVGGYLVSALVGVSCARWVPQLPLAAALAVSLSILGMLWLRCVHPPGGAVALYAVLGGPPVHELGYGFVLMPVLANALLLVASALVVNNLLPHRHYPRRLPAEPPPQAPAMPLAPSHDDVSAALAQYDHLLDIGEEDLDAVVALATQRLLRRAYGPLTVADVMMPAAPSVRSDAAPRAAWRLLRRHRLPVIAVVDAEQRLQGLVGIDDFLDRAGARGPQDLRRRLGRLLLRGAGGAERVAALMVPPVATPRPDMHVAELMPYLGPRGGQGIPVVDRAHRYLGMVSPGALVAALYRAGLAKAPAGKG